MPKNLEDKPELTASDAVAMNEALLLGLVRQHELTEVAEHLNTQLQAEMTARKKTEEALVNSEKLASVGRMAAVLAHEINNPLEAVMNLLFLVQSSTDLPEQARHYLKIADAEVKRIANITRQTLGFYRERATPATFRLAILLESILDMLEAKRNSKRAVIDTQCADQLQLTTFQGELRQVLSNLLMNSLDAIAEDGRITFRATLSKDFRAIPHCIRITVSDNGPGMSQTVLSQIFQPFFTTKGAVGNGLGLWVSQQIIEKHGGTIHVRSRTDGPHQGTTFSLILPVLVE